MSTKEQYWKYSLITIILVMGVVIFFKATPFLGGLLGQRPSIFCFAIRCSI